MLAFKTSPTLNEHFKEGAYLKNRSPSEAGFEFGLLWQVTRTWNAGDNRRPDLPSWTWLSVKYIQSLFPAMASVKSAEFMEGMACTVFSGYPIDTYVTRFGIVQEDGSSLSIDELFAQFHGLRVIPEQSRFRKIISVFAESRFTKASNYLGLVYLDRYPSPQKGLLTYDDGHLRLTVPKYSDALEVRGYGILMVGAKTSVSQLLVIEPTSNLGDVYKRVGFLTIDDLPWENISTGVSNTRNLYLT